MLAEELGKRVVIVDTSNEIGGDGDIPHAGIGRARRMQVRGRSSAAAARALCSMAARLPHHGSLTRSNTRPLTTRRPRPAQVPNPDVQHRVMIEGVENHMPEVIVIDEIGSELECLAARTIAQRGVQLVATAHGNELENVIKNPALADLVGSWWLLAQGTCCAAAAAGRWACLAACLPGCVRLCLQ